MSKLSTIAWDTGRLVAISRACFYCGYITETEAWNYIQMAYDKSKPYYSNWNDFAQGYVVGRAMWSGNDLSFSGIMDIAKGLRDDAKSPWKQMLFK